MFPVDLQLKIQPFGPESAFFRDSPSGARGGVAQLPARRPRCMRRQGQRSPFVSVFFAVLRCFFRVPSEGRPPGSFTPLVAHPEPSAPHPWLRAPCGFFGSLLPIVSARRAGRRALAPCVSESSRRGWRIGTASLVYRRRVLPVCSAGLASAAAALMGKAVNSCLPNDRGRDTIPSCGQCWHCAVHLKHLYQTL